VSKSMKEIADTLKRRIDATRAAKQKEDRQQWLDDKAIETGEIEGHRFWVVPSPGMANETPDFVARFGRVSGLNGYLHFDKRPVSEPEDGGLLVYVPVHGGITFWGNHDGGVVYGFDSGHHDSGRYPTREPSWVKDELTIMLAGIKAAARVESAYLAAIDPEARALLAEEVNAVRAGYPFNFRTTLNVLRGRI